MSRNLENEYREMMHQDLPDLWARIEAALPEKVSAVEESFTIDEPETITTDYVNNANKTNNANNINDNFTKNIKTAYNTELILLFFFSFIHEQSFLSKITSK